MIDAQKTQSEELLALADTIKVLNDDNALELFKKTLPGSSASFMQVTVSSKAMQQKALAILAQVNSPRVDLLEVALRGGKQGFGEIIKMIDNLTAELKTAQKDDDDKKDYCEAESDKAGDKKKGFASDAECQQMILHDEIVGFKGACKYHDYGRVMSVAEVSDCFNVKECLAEYHPITSKWGACYVDDEEGIERAQRCLCAPMP